MEISAKTDYAVRAMLMLAAEGPDARLSAESLAQRQDLPHKFLEAILGDLRRAKLVTSVRGAGGGYRLALPAEEIMLGAVFRAVSGPLAGVRGLRPHETSYEGVGQHLPTVWVAVRSALRQVLDEVSLLDVLAGEYPKHVQALADLPDAWVNR